VAGYITGIHRSPFHGFSVEFSEYRPYNPGESTRFIDWKLYARTDKLFVKQFEDETNLRARIIIDASNSMLYPMLDNGDEELRSKYNMSMYMAAVFYFCFISNAMPLDFPLSVMKFWNILMLDLHTLIIDIYFLC